MNFDLLRRVLVEIDDAQTSKRAANAECISDRDLFNSYVSRLKDDGYVVALIQPDMSGRNSIHAVVTKGLTPIGRDLLIGMKNEELLHKAKEAEKQAAASWRLTTLAAFLKVNSRTG